MEADRITASPLKIAMIGAGNVAWSLAPALDTLEGVEIVCVWSRTSDRSAALAAQLSVRPIVADTLDDIPDNADLYLLSLVDDAVADVARRIKCRPGAIAAHTSGGVNASVLAPMTSRYGVFYPLQTFTHGRRIEDLRRVPFFIEGSDEPTAALLERLAARLSDNTVMADSRRRAVIHAAAVFACNFTTHLMARADDILHSEGLDLSLLHPLIEETIRKSEEITPAAAQTGPARRGDRNCIRHHEELLAPAERELYHILSESITEYYSR